MGPHSKVPADPTPILEFGSLCVPDSPPSAKRVCDVIGDPAFWPNHLHRAGPGVNDFRGATISDVIVVGSDIAVCTSGGQSGRTFSVFTIEDEQLRSRVVRALRYGLNVYVAAFEQI